ncbi:leucyl aminopeptidase [Puniceicoccus vermicola]|uniref:Probable cytosol aminopeptidase n=1 Tax=Puniceicoccus vermicola TaxID=388746 RepID=A0A7X1B022_9BACT|nr:leucyl aminopeptidase [Puniceicoccus vermicola]MBC2603143.1 leucyl aminopeptidase [Puniceicoccus vermicola]
MSERIQIKASDSASANADLVLFKTKGDFIPRPFRSEEFDGSAQTCLLFHAAERREFYVGLGDADQVTSNSYRQASGQAIRKAINLGSDEILIDVSEIENRVVEIAQGLTVGAYHFDEFQAEKKTKKTVKVVLIGPKKSLKSIRNLIARGISLGQATNYVRHLGNLPGNIITPETLAKEARNLGQEHELKCQIWTKSGLQRDGFGGLLAVGGGSSNDPRLIRLDYTTEKKNAPTLALVGKAITFDSGGLCIKGADHMDEMKFDKMGGCSVLGIMKAVAELKPDCNVIGILASAENMTGGSAYRPGDIVRTFDGQTVEVANTDAEGRIVLADALGYVRERVKPDMVIDMATLTGACVAALGEERGGLFCRDEDLTRIMQKCGEQTGERVWPLPFEEEFDSQIESEVADVRNLGKTRWGGASTAATFLARWTKGLPHIHLDIAGPAMTAIPKQYRGPGATGFGVGLVYAFVESWTQLNQKSK